MSNNNWDVVKINRKYMYYQHTKNHRLKKNLINFIKLIYGLACFIGFLVQIWMFSNLYWQYPVRMEMESDFLTGPEMPAVTACNSNGYKRSKICESTSFAKNCATLNFSNYHQVKSFLLKVFTRSTFAQKISFGHQFLDLIIRCIPMPICFESQHLLSHSFFSGNCYTINGNFTGKRNGSNIKRTTAGGNFNAERPEVMAVFFAVESKDYLCEEEESVKFQVHNRFEIPLHMNTAFQLDKGFYYQMYITKSTTKSLPPPYYTGCKDYQQHFAENGWKGPLSSQACVYECIHRVTKDCGYNLIMRAHYPVLVEDLKLVLSMLDSNTTVRACRKFKIKEICKKCAEECPRPCEYSYFTTEIQRQTYRARAFRTLLSARWEHVGVKSEQIPDTRVNIVYKTLEHRVFVFKPQFQPIEIFSFIGGYIGIWLGISLWSLPKESYQIFYWFRKAKHV